LDARYNLFEDEGKDIRRDKEMRWVMRWLFQTIYCKTKSIVEYGKLF